MEELAAMVEKYGGLLPEILDRLERECLSHAFGIWSGYAAFCEESMGVPQKKAAAVVLGPFTGRIEAMVDRAEGLEVEAEPETVEQVREGLAEAWRVVEQRGV